MGESFMGMSHVSQVTGARSYGDALGRLSAAQKSAAGVPAYLRWVNRPLGRRLAALAYVARLTPNQVTMLSGVAATVAIVVLVVFSPTVPVALVVSAAMLLGYGLDSADGQLARLTGSSGPSGEFLDHVVDAIRQPATHLAIAASLQLRGDLSSRWPVLVAIGFATVSSVWFFGQILAASLLPRQTAAPGASAPAWMSFVKIPYDVGFLYLLLLLLPWAWTFVACYVALFVFTVAVAVLSLWRKYQSLQAAGAVS
jgi:phosphatidylglycerophosphate synthase